VAYPFVNAGSQHFRVFLNLDEEVISFDPDIAYEQSDFKSVDEHSSLLELDKSCIIFNNLLTQTFEAACQANYQKQQVRRTYADTLETDDFTLFGYGEEDIDAIDENWCGSLKMRYTCHWKVYTLNSRLFSIIFHRHLNPRCIVFVVAIQSEPFIDVRDTIALKLL